MEVLEVSKDLPDVGPLRQMQDKYLRFQRRRRHDPLRGQSQWLSSERPRAPKSYTRS